MPDYCQVSPYRGEWRGLTSVREIAALNSKASAKAPSADQLAEWARPVERIKDEEELAHTVTWLSLVATGAESAMFHYRRRNTKALVTRSVLGPISNERLGYALPEQDLGPEGSPARATCPRSALWPDRGCARHSLRRQSRWCGRGRDGSDFRRRYSDRDARAVTPGHAFRRTDLQRAERLAQQAMRVRSN